MKPLIFNLSSERIANQLNLEIGEFVLRNFPDQETYIQILSDVKNKNIIIFDSLYHPNTKILDFILFSDTLKTQGARKVGLITPYLPYMRQDTQFKSGESVTSKHFAKLLSTHLDWLVTIDPHLHRYKNLSEIYTIPTTVLTSAGIIANYIQENIPKPVLIGPDSESEQWVKSITDIIHAPYLILKKTRFGDKHVEVSIPKFEQYTQHTPVLVDDIISTGHTMLETIKHIKTFTEIRPICIGVHGLFIEDADKKIQQAGVDKIVTCNTIPHSSNHIDITQLIVAFLETADFLR